MHVSVSSLWQIFNIVGQVFDFILISPHLHPALSRRLLRLERSSPKIPGALIHSSMPPTAMPMFAIEVHSLTLSSVILTAEERTSQ